MILSQIAAMAKNRVIGKDNTLPWKLPEDMKFFRRMTQGKLLIMGRKTFESFPGALPDRYHIIISRSKVVSEEPDLTFVTSVEEAVALAKKLSPKYPGEVFVVGGAEIYRQTMDLTDKIYLTVIEQDFDGDTYFPDVPEDKFHLSKKEDRPGPPAFSFRTYERIK